MSNGPNSQDLFVLSRCARAQVANPGRSICAGDILTAIKKAGAPKSALEHYTERRIAAVIDRLETMGFLMIAVTIKEDSRWGISTKGVDLLESLRYEA